MYNLYPRFEQAYHDTFAVKKILSGVQKHYSKKTIGLSTAALDYASRDRRSKHFFKNLRLTGDVEVRDVLGVAMHVAVGDKKDYPLRITTKGVQIDHWNTTPYELLPKYLRFLNLSGKHARFHTESKIHLNVTPKALTTYFDNLWFIESELERLTANGKNGNKLKKQLTDFDLDNLLLPELEEEYLDKGRPSFLDVV